MRTHPAVGAIASTLFLSLCLSLALSLSLSMAACTAEWNDAAPGFALTGSPPSLDSLDKLNRMPATTAILMQGPDGAPWTAFCEFRTGSLAGGGDGGGPRSCNREHLVRLGPIPTGVSRDDVVTGDSIVPRFTALYIFHDDKQAMSRGITIHRPGRPAAENPSFTVSLGPAIFYVNDGGADDVFVHWLIDPATTRFDIFRADGRYHRRLPVPAGVDPAKPARSIEFLLTSDGSRLVLRAPDGQITVYSTLDEESVPLGIRPATYLIDDARHAIITVGDDGLRSVPLDGRGEKPLTTDPIDPVSLRFTTDAAWYGRGGDLYRVPLDGSAPPVLVQGDAARLVSLGPSGQVIYSHDPGNRYVGGAGDGWLGGWNFMERGRRLRWSGDGRRLRFLEHAAVLGVYGDLTSVDVPPAGDGTAMGSAPFILGVNVHAYAELPDGRVLADENHVYNGAWNRLVVIDEDAKTKRWVAPSVTDFLVTPDGSEIIADVVSGASGFDVYRLLAPPK